MSSEPAITLYDLSSKLCPQPWGSNTWKARLVLNYKCIPYKTVWVPYPDIEHTLKKVGSTRIITMPNDPSTLRYTLPAIVDISSGAPVMVLDSEVIAEYLDERYPDRPIFPREGRALQSVFEDYFGNVVAKHFVPLLLPLTWEILDAHSKPHFREMGERPFGKKFEDFSPEGPVRETHWQALEKGFDQLAAIMDKNGPGVDFVAGGTEPTRADMIIIAHIAWLKAVAPEEGWNSRLRHWSGGRWERLWNRSKEWRAIY